MLKALAYLFILALTVGSTPVASAQEFDPFAVEPQYQQQPVEELNKYGEKASTAEQALEYYDYCMSTRNRHMCTESQDNFCGCAALRIREEMSLGDMRMYDKTVSSRDSATLVFISRVVGPCLYRPVYDNAFKQCLKRPDLIKSYAPYHVRICECTGKRMKSFTDRIAGPYASQMIASDYDGRSAYARIFGSTKYSRELRNAMDNCAIKISRGN